MVIGHYGVGFALKRKQLGISLGTLFFASQVTDILSGLLLVIGVERVQIIPGYTAVVPLKSVSISYSHTLLTCIILGILFGAAVYISRKNIKASIVVFGAVISHWFLDVLVHAKDMALYPGGELYGLLLWNSVIGTIAVEGLIFLIGIILFLKYNVISNRKGKIIFGTTIILMVLLYISNFIFTNPPDNSQLIGVGLFLYTLPFIFLGYWLDRNCNLKESGK